MMGSAVGSAVGPAVGKGEGSVVGITGPAVSAGAGAGVVEPVSSIGRHCIIRVARERYRRDRRRATGGKVLSVSRAHRG